MKRIIWQYWETRELKPLFVDDLYDIAKNNSGVEVIQVTPETLNDYIHDIPPEIYNIKEMAHKADMIRALLIYQHGGMWLDSDAIVLSDLNWLFDMLSEYEFIGFNNNGSLFDNPLNIRINCFLSKPKSNIMKYWVESQHKKFPKIVYRWGEIGTELLDPIILKSSKKVKLLNFDIISPIKYNEVSRFSSILENSKNILRDAEIVMLSNKSLQGQCPYICQTPLKELAKDETLIADIIKKALGDNNQSELSNAK